MKNNKLVLIKYIFLIVCIVLSLSTIGCSNQEQQINKISNIGKELQGEHLLRKMYTISQTNSYIKGNAWLFFVIGEAAIKGETTQKLKVYFAWKNNRNEYVISSLPIEKIRIQFNNNITTPYIKFKWKVYSRSYEACLPENLMEDVIYAVVVCNEKDWNLDINIPLNNKETINATKEISG